MGKYDFDKIIDRRNTSCLKYDFGMKRKGRTDLLPMWVADMDFALPEEILADFHRWSILWSLAPKYLPMITVPPNGKPIEEKKTLMLVIMVVELTAASAWVPTKLPTTMESTVLYNIWNTLPTISGRANSSSSRGMLPRVISFVLVCAIGFLPFCSVHRYI